MAEEMESLQKTVNDLDPKQKQLLIEGVDASIKTQISLLNEIESRGDSNPTVEPTLTIAEQPTKPVNLSSNHELIDGRYRLGRRIGGGGFGVVYSAEHIVLARRVAIKFLKIPDWNAAKSLFSRELRIAGMLQHENVVHATDASIAPPTPFLVTEYLEGKDLKQLLSDVKSDNNNKRSGLRIGVACEIVRQACLGIQHAHDSGLVHRDVKPSNLFLNPTGTVKVLDFGLACVREEVGDLSAAESIKGTVDYIPPEQWHGSADPLPESDIYAIGCTLFELLTGRPPFFEMRTLPAKMAAHLNAEPPRVREFAPHVSIWLERIIQKCLRKSPTARYSKPADLAERLQRFCYPAQVEVVLEKHVRK